MYSLNTMRSLLFIFILKFSFSVSQTKEAINAGLWQQHDAIKKASCNDGQLLTNRGMNLFFADRVGYYLSDPENLTFCKNNITLNSGTGIFSMGHSLFEPTSADLPVKAYNVIGLKANVFNAFQAAANNSTFNNELGFTFKRFWVSKPKLNLNNCSEKQFFDAGRAIIVKQLSAEISNKGTDFENTLINITDLPDVSKKELKADFYKNLKEEYSRKFAELQYRALFDSLRFNRLKSNWTNFNLYIPVILQRFTVAENLNSAFSIKKTFPAELSINHTRFIETQRASKLYLNFRAGILMNNTINSKMLNWTSEETYRVLGGKYVSYLTDKQLDKANIGKFENFITPNIKAQIVYFPPENHFGISCTIEQNFGKYKALNGIIGIPIVLIDKQSAPQTNLEIQIRYFNLTNTLNSGRGIRDNVSLSITWGQPIGRNVY